MDKDTLETTLFSVLAIQILDQRGLLRIVLATNVTASLSKTDDGKYTYTDVNGESLSWLEPDNAVRYLMMATNMHKTSIDNVIFYPTTVATTGVTWRGLKADMPFLRIVLLKDAKILSSIVDRITSIMFAVKDTPSSDPTLN
jgi:hypothetical protein